ncbi:MAG: hypothetical protein EOO61_09575 [Hymenobacter sp.]|nr:MAG: hypothetical protein EOO61_09575 [Hymenobacter sp.]
MHFPNGQLCMFPSITAELSQTFQVHTHTFERRLPTCLDRNLGRQFNWSGMTASGEAFTYLVGKYDTVTVDATSFRKSFANNKGTLVNFNKSNNSWFLTPEGEERVKSWILGQAKTFKSKQAE